MSASSPPSPAGRRTATTASAMALVIAIAAPLPSARAQQSPDSPPAAWRVECTGDGKTLDCRAVQQVFHRETRQLLVSVAVRPAADGKSGAMLMTLPLGLNLDATALAQPGTRRDILGDAQAQAVAPTRNLHLHCRLHRS